MEKYLTFPEDRTEVVLKALDEMKVDMKTDMTGMKTEVLSALTSLKDRVGAVEQKVDTVEGHVDTLFDLNSKTKKQVDILGAVVAQQRGELDREKELTKQHDEHIRELQQRLAALESRQQVTEETHELIQNTQHDDYDKAFKKEEFQKVFLFLITFGHNTYEGCTCVVFHEVNRVLCVCINLRALTLIAKLKLSYSQVTKAGKFPSSNLFKINSLRQMFRDAKLPQMELDNDDVEKLCSRSAMRLLKSPAGNKSSWIALEADPFLLAMENLDRGKKIQPFRELFQKHYPKSIKPKKVTDKDMCYFLGSTDVPTSVKQPVFQVEYWRELFYPAMKEYRRRLTTPEEVQGHVHFLSLYELNTEEILNRDEVLQQAAEQKEAEDNQTRNKSTSSITKRRREVEEDEESEDEHAFEDRAPQDRTPQKRPRHVI